MTDEQIKKLLKAQQGELDAVLLYQAIAGLVKDEAMKEKLKQIAADEGKHASILRAYTEKVLRPKRTKAVVVSFLYRILGHSAVCTLLSNGEMKSIPSYETLVSDFPRIKEIMEDELRHAQITRECGKSASQ